MANRRKGYVQIYTGDGKGKTTAALGLAIRASGAGLKVAIIQFMKGTPYSEIEALKKVDTRIQIYQTGRSKCIRQDEVTDEDRAEAQRGITLAGKYLQDDVDVLILDEILVAHWFGLVSLNDINKLLTDRPDNIEMILTGRKAPPEIIEQADLVTEMTEIKHYYQVGVPARLGIEM
jgi:cob(I)alamin adenosyltransferase